MARTAVGRFCATFAMVAAVLLLLPKAEGRLPQVTSVGVTADGHLIPDAKDEQEAAVAPGKPSEGMVAAVVGEKGNIASVNVGKTGAATKATPLAQQANLAAVAVGPAGESQAAPSTSSEEVHGAAADDETALEEEDAGLVESGRN